MRALFRVFLLVMVLSFVLSASGEAQVGFRVKGGFSYIAYGEYNDFADNNNEMLLEAKIAGAEYDNMNWVPEFGGEVTLSVIPTVTVGLGAGMILGTADFAFSMVTLNANYEHKMKAYPITATGYFKPAVPFTFAKPFFFGGIGLYYSKLTFSESYESSVVMPDTTSYDSELTKCGFGLHGGAGIEFVIAPMVSFELCVMGRWVDIKGYEGTRTRADGTSEDVYLAYDSVYIARYGVDVPYYGPLSVDEKSRYEEGSVNLSGYGFTLGLRVAF
ncbi:MAG: outer membrane beta-barrel protein [Candidatus Krumholzibacteria bacterium]|nr:outer membrane beta-barrel protein [Candidatus Krumholzibacteria bacterium]